MKRFTQQFQIQAKKERLTAEERFMLRDRITTFMEYHPLPKERTEHEKRLLSAPWTEPYLVINFPWKKLRVGVSMLVLSVVIAVPAFAEQTLPGDMLYGVKVNVNEEVRGSFARTSVEKTEWETKRLERRLAEARALLKLGKLTDDVQTAMITVIEKQKQTVKNEINNLRRDNNDEAELAQLTITSMMDVQMVAFETQLTAQGEAGDSKSVNNENPFVTLVTNTKLEFESEMSSTTVPYERLVPQLERQTTRAFERLASLKRTISVHEYTDINRRLQDIQQKMVTANSYRDTDSARSVQILRQSLADVQKLLTFMNDLDVRTAVAVERVVPKTLTYEERLAILQTAFVDIKSDTERIKAQVQQEPDTSATQKVSSYVPMLDSFVVLSETISVDNIDQIEQEWLRVSAIIESIKAIMPLPPVIPNVTDGQSVEEQVVPATTTASTTLNS